MGDTSYGAPSVQEAVAKVDPETTVIVPVHQAHLQRAVFEKPIFRLTEKRTITSSRNAYYLLRIKGRRKNTKSDPVVRMPKAQTYLKCLIKQKTDERG